jgi:hypothetical protein
MRSILLSFVAFSTLIGAAQPAATKKKTHVAAQTHTTQTHTAQAHAATPHAAVSRTGAHKAAAHHSAGKKTSARRRASVPRYQVQAAPAPDRVREIQGALAAKGYLKTDPSGQWDAASQDAMKRFQADQKLDQTGKLNSLSLIALGLGPKRDPAPEANADPVK